MYLCCAWSAWGHCHGVASLGTPKTPGYPRAVGRLCLRGGVMQLSIARDGRQVGVLCLPVAGDTRGVSVLPLRAPGWHREHSQCLGLGPSWCLQGGERAGCSLHWQEKHPPRVSGRQQLRGRCEVMGSHPRGASPVPGHPCSALGGPE